MAEYTRRYLKMILARMKEPRKFIQVVAGPRQVGKTTLVNQFTSKAKEPCTFVAMDAIPAASMSSIASVWDAVRIQMKTSKAKSHILIFDEIQKVDDWSEQVKKEWDADTWNNVNIKILLLGSSRLLIKKGFSESLAGRFELIRIPHWSFAEMQDAFDFSLEQYLFFGGYPGSASLVKDEVRFLNYIKDTLVESTLSKDILLLTPVAKPALLRQLFELAAANSGEPLALSKIQGQMQDAGNTVTLSHYLKLLDESGLVAGLEKYSGSVLRKRNSVPKYQVYNNALRNIYSGKNFKDAVRDAEGWGRIVESAIGAHLINNAATEGMNLYYWREQNSEVDFVLESKQSIVAIEVKSGKRKNSEGLARFRKLYNPSRAFVVGTGGVPVEKFLKMNLVDLF